MQAGKWLRTGLSLMAITTLSLIGASIDAGEADVVRGRVADAEGNGLKATLFVLSLEDGHLVARHDTAPDGTFELELPAIPVEIAPDRRERRASWEFSPVASRASGGLELDFTGFVERHKGLRGRLVDAVSGAPLGNRVVTIQHQCEVDDRDPAARFRQSMIRIVRTDARGQFNAACQLGCASSMLFHGDAGYDRAALQIEAGDCAARHSLAAEPR